MKILLVACSPRRPSLGHSLAGTLREDLGAAGHEVAWHDLYEEGFDPVMPPGELLRGASLDDLVVAHAKDLVAAEGLIIVHPDWWSGPPAILKGWIDRVFREGVAWELEGDDGYEKTWKPLLEGRRALVLVTSDSTDHRREHCFGSLWVDAVLGACGMEAECRFIGRLRKSSEAERRAWIGEARQRARELFG